MITSLDLRSACYGAFTHVCSQPGFMFTLKQVGTEIGEEGADVDALMKKMDRLQTAIDAANGWELDRQVARATDALRCPPGMLS